MKYSTSPLLFVVVAAIASSGKKTMGQEQEQDNRELASLSDKWSIADPIFGYTGLDFTFDYDVSNFIDVGQAYYEVYDSGCKSGGNPPVSTGFTLDPLVDVTAGSITDDGTFNVAADTVEVPLSIDVNTITGNIDVYTETNTAGSISATIEFCVRFGLKTKSGGATPVVEVNFLESLVTLNVDLSSGFSIADVSVAPKERLISTGSTTYTVNGYMCNPGTSTEFVPVTPLSQGSLITICIKPDQAGIDDGIKMRTIDLFQWSRDLTTQTAVASGIAADNLLTTYDPATCASGDYCSFSSILFAAFYSTAGQVSGTGIASMQFGTTRRLNSGGLRSLQKLQDKAATSEFDLAVTIEAADYDNDGPITLQTAAGATAGTTMLAAIAGLVGVTIALL